MRLKGTLQPRGSTWLEWGLLWGGGASSAAEHDIVGLSSQKKKRKVSQILLRHNICNSWQFVCCVYHSGGSRFRKQKKKHSSSEYILLCVFFYPVATFWKGWKTFRQSAVPLFITRRRKNCVWHLLWLGDKTTCASVSAQLPGLKSPEGVWEVDVSLPLIASFPSFFFFYPRRL